MKNREEAGHYLTIFIFTAPSAVVVWLVFHAVYVNLTQDAAVVGYVEAGTQMGIFFGYIVMVGGTAVLGGIAAWAAFRLVRTLLRDRFRSG